MVSFKSQRGVVLIIALVFLVSLTALASVLMLNTTSDVKMSGASDQKFVAQQQAISAVDETISDQLTSPTNLFVSRADQTPVNTVNNVSVTDVVIVNVNPPNLEAGCPHQRHATSGLVCNILRVQVNKNYGKNNTSNVNVNSGIAQHMYPTGN